MKDTIPITRRSLAGNYVLGAGALSSRLGDRVRQKEGLSYGVGSHIFAEPLDERASLTLYANYNPANVEKVKKAIREELVRIVKEGIQPDELARAKTGYIEEHKVDRTNDTALAGMLAEGLFVDRTMAFYAELESKVNSLTAEDVLAALQKYIVPERLSTVEAGDFKAADAAAEKSSATPATAEKPAAEGDQKPGAASKPVATKPSPSKPAAPKSAGPQKKKAAK